MCLQPQENIYTPLFCEENIWFLAQKLLGQGVSDNRMFVLFFSNFTGSIVLFSQNKARQGHLIVWDYHVVLQVHQDHSDWIYDIDSRLPLPSPLTTYFSQTFPNQRILPANYRTKIRQIPADEYLRHFSSDRSHMVGKIPPDQFPDYPIITPAIPRSAIALADYIDMHKELNDHSLVFDVMEYPGDTKN